jgi:cytochrome c556
MLRILLRTTLGAAVLVAPVAAIKTSSVMSPTPRFSRGTRGAIPPGARDLAARLAAFADDGRRVLDQVGQPSAVAAGFKRMLDDCQACHAIYN